LDRQRRHVLSRGDRRRRVRELARGNRVQAGSGVHGVIQAARKTRATSAPTIVGGDVFYTKRTDTRPGAGASEAIARNNAEAPARGYTTGDKKAAYLDSAVQTRSMMKESGDHLDSANGFSSGAPAAANPTLARNNIGLDNVSTLQSFQGSRILNVAGDNVNVMGDEIVCTRADDGKERWKLPLTGDLKRSGGALGAPPVAAGDSLFVATLAGDVLRIARDSGKVVARYNVGSPIRAQPAVEDGFLYVGTTDGKLVAIDLGDRRLSGWPMWGGNAARTGTRP
jgi:outer membrane protein assembly factor BamB